MKFRLALQQKTRLRLYFKACSDPVRQTTLARARIGAQVDYFYIVWYRIVSYHQHDVNAADGLLQSVL